MILRWTGGGLADLELIHRYQKLHWPAMLAPFEARLTAIERRIIEFPLSVVAALHKRGPKRLNATVPVVSGIALATNLR
jgi:hypothetical protein